MVRVQTQYGKVFTGEVDVDTDENVLWLRTTAPSILLKVSVRWSLIDSVIHAEQQFSTAQFRVVAENLKSDVPADIFAPTAADHDRSSQIESRPEETSRPPRKVQSIRIRADAANWDADVELDGLELWVMPVDSASNTFPVEGMLSVQLIGQNHGGHRHAENRHRGPRRAFPEIGRWSRKIRITDYDGFEGARVRLPFRTVNPEHDLKFGSYGIVHARLGVTGHGTFEASRQVRVRSGGMMRDDLQLLKGRRFFSSERTSRRVGEWFTLGRD